MSFKQLPDPRSHFSSGFGDMGRDLKGRYSVIYLIEIPKPFTYNPKPVNMDFLRIKYVWGLIQGGGDLS